jgi:hypothetical protein
VALNNALTVKILLNVIQTICHVTPQNVQKLILIMVALVTMTFVADPAVQYFMTPLVILFVTTLLLPVLAAVLKQRIRLLSHVRPMLTASVRTSILLLCLHCFAHKDIV